MATMQMLVQEPQPRTLRLADISLLFNLEFSDEQADALSEQYLGLISDELSRFDKNYNFSIGGEEIDVDDLYLEFGSVASGSIRVNLILVGTFLVASYNAVAVYPDFKDGFIELKADIQSVLDSAVDRVPTDQRDHHRPVAVEIVRKDDDEILAEIAENQ